MKRLTQLNLENEEPKNGASVNVRLTLYGQTVSHELKKGLKKNKKKLSPNNYKGPLTYSKEVGTQATGGLRRKY